MNVLVIGSGGREHALVWKLKQSKLVTTVFCAPGNAGIAMEAQCVDIDATDINGLLRFARDTKIDFTVVGPEAPLVIGIVDEFEKNGMPIFGPSQKAAELEGSKVFMKYLLEKYDIPTAQYRVFKEYEDAVAFIKNTGIPVVVKADGLAAGKGAIVCNNRQEAFDALDIIMKKRAFGDAGNQVIIEECLQGYEVSVLAIADGEDLIYLAPAQDHKRILDNDEGPNTGGMGAYAPAPQITPELMMRIHHEIMLPTLKGMALEDRPYKGVLYAGLMITASGPKVLEYNCRFGDPETQAILPLTKSDLLQAMMAARDGMLKDMEWENHPGAAVCVVIASGGYPGHYEKGKPILGLDSRIDDNIMVFHAGTRWEGENIVTSGGRVLGVTAVGNTIKEAINSVYKAVGKIAFDGAYYRKDIGAKAVKYQETL
ncbi:MAG TPA: phosphoribosylamine--glycine ligase [bacterium]|nr:phosphoribosylamine--glycine ligase [bacterium]HPN42251.1 phosphoribosylamine--glycine ligase [bacterium]